MNPFLKPLVAMFIAWATSKKVLTAVLTAIAALLIKDTAVRDRVVGVGITLIAAIAVTDHGKAAAEVAAANPPPVAPAAPAPTATANVTVEAPPA